MSEPGDDRTEAADPLQKRREHESDPARSFPGAYDVPGQQFLVVGVDYGDVDVRFEPIRRGNRTLEAEAAQAIGAHTSLASRPIAITTGLPENDERAAHRSAISGS